MWAQSWTSSVWTRGGISSDSAERATGSEGDGHLAHAWSQAATP